MFSYRQNRDGSGRAAETKVELSEWGAGVGEVSPMVDLATGGGRGGGGFVLVSAWAPVDPTLGSSVTLGSCSTSWG